MSLSVTVWMLILFPIALPNVDVTHPAAHLPSGNLMTHGILFGREYNFCADSQLLCILVFKINMILSVAECYAPYSQKT